MGGLKPGITTDTVATLVAERIKADLLVKGTDQNGVYNKDPRKYPDAIKLDHLTFEEYLAAVEHRREESVIFRGFLNGIAPEYVERHRPAEIVRDFIAGMTDHYFIAQCPEHLRPAYLQCPEP